MSFSHPWLLLAAAALTAAFALLYRAVESRRAASALRYSNLAFMVEAMKPRQAPSRIIAVAWIAAVALLCVAIAGPHVRAAVPIRDGFVVLCVDTSGSMSATDVQPTRAQAALRAMRAFIAATPGGTAIGIVAFATNAQAVLQPTRDPQAVASALGEIPFPNGATAIGDALALAQRMLPPHGHRVVVLITDGENNTGIDPLAAAQALGAAGIPLYTVGIGTNSGALIPGTLQAAGIDESALRSYAAAAGGAYSRANDANQLRTALAQLGRTVSFAPKLVDVSLASAIAGGALMALAFLGGVAAGRYP